MSSKDLYEEEDLNEDVEEEDDEDEIIDNDDGGFEESIVVQENKAKKEEKEEEKTIPQEKMKQTETELDKYSKEDLLNILLNNPVNAQGTIEHDDNKEVNINISEANQKVKNLSPEGEEADFDTALTKILSQMVKDPNKKIKGNFNWLKKSGWNNINDVQIILPAKETDEIDWDYMESFIDDIEIECKEQKQQQLQRIIELYGSVGDELYD